MSHLLHCSCTMVYHGIPCLHYGIAEELIQLKYTITKKYGPLCDSVLSLFCVIRLMRSLKAVDYAGIMILDHPFHLPTFLSLSSISVPS